MASGPEYDYLICGGGTAGCVVASRLKRGNPSLSIAVIERGQDRSTDPLILNPLAFSHLADAGLRTLFHTTEQAHLDNRRIEQTTGNVLSGSSAINVGAWFRGHKKDYDHWAELTGDSRWSYEGLLPYFKRSETHYDPDGDPEQHGFDGPIKSVSGRVFPFRQPVHDAFVEIGFKDQLDPNNGDPLGVYQFVENGSPVRQPAASAYGLGGIDVITEATIKRILLQKGDSGLEATGVELADGRTFRAKKEVILSCGAFCTPQLLMLSGIGPTDHLSALGIKTVLDTPDVGKNFFDHPSTTVILKMNREIAAEKGLLLGTATFMQNPKHLQGAVIEWCVLGALPRGELNAALQADARDSKVHEDDPALAGRPNFMIAPIYLPLPNNEESWKVHPDGEHFCIKVFMGVPTSRGSVTLASTDPREPPVVDANYLSTHHDRYIMRAGTRKVLELAESKALEPFEITVIGPGREKPLTSRSSDEEIDKEIRQAAGSIWHPAGTAAMGNVVDTALKVKGVKNLRVCDASVFPAPTTVMIQAAVYAVAESFADLILQEK